MKLSLRENKKDYFESKMEELSPWMHSFFFDEEIITGYFKYQNIDPNLTFINRKSPSDKIRMIQAAYYLSQEETYRNFFKKMIGCLSIDQESRKDMTVLDISSATGKHSLYAIEEGFGKVISSEIRKNQCDQFNLILDCIEKPYKKSITVINDIISADDKEFPKKYTNEMKPDLLLSFGLLYHLTNPYQHIKNNYEITNKYAIIYTMTHMNPLKKNTWKLNIENEDWITKATSSISWTPHFMDVIDLCKSVGFRKVKMVYPDFFEKNFSGFKNYNFGCDLNILYQAFISRIFNINIGLFKNNQSSYFKYTGLNPNYFAYICEK